MSGQSGGSIIDDFQFDAFEFGIRIDGSADTVRIINPHWWPFFLTKAQYTLFLDQGKDRPVAIEVGRMDDLNVSGGLFLGGLALHAFHGRTGSVGGSIVNTDFDTCSGIVVDDGALQISASSFSLGVDDAQAVKIAAGTVTIGSSFFFLGVKTRSAIVASLGGDLTITGSDFVMHDFDVTAVQQRGVGSLVNITADRFKRLPNIVYHSPTILLLEGRTIAMSNYISNIGIGSGLFFSVENDNPYNRIIGNSASGWKNSWPTSGLGVYLFN